MFPREWYPAPCRAALQWYLDTYKDPLVSHSTEEEKELRRDPPKKEKEKNLHKKTTLFFISLSLFLDGLSPRLVPLPGLDRDLSPAALFLLRSELLRQGRPKGPEARSGLWFLRRDDARAYFGRAGLWGASAAAEPRKQAHAGRVLLAVFRRAAVDRHVDAH